MGKHGPRETVIWNGRTYGRYPESPRKGLRDYYDCGRGGGSLHRAIWAHHNGPIPKGVDIHHVDGNPLNNDISNLEALGHGEHRSRHMGPEIVAKLRENIKRAQLAAPEWHRSAEGRRWHAKHASHEHAATKSGSCEFCNGGFVAKFLSKRFCSVRCTGAARRAARTSFEQRRCVLCAAEFSCESYRPTRTCSRRCSARYRWGWTPERLRPVR